MIAVDTSVWVAARREPDVFDTLHALIDADEVALPLPVRLELWAGTAKKDRAAFQRAFGALVQIVPTEDTWTPVGGWIERAADAGQHFTITDLVIAALAHEIDALVWSIDGDFERMEALGIVRLYAPGRPSTRRAVPASRPRRTS